MNSSFQGKCAMVVGGCTCIGSAVCKLLAKSGASVAVCDSNMQSINKLISELQLFKTAAVGIVCEVTDRESMRHAAAQTAEILGGIDVLVNCISYPEASLKRKPVMEWSLKEWDSVIDTEMTGVYNSMKPVLAQMVKQGRGGSIVNMGSDHGLVPIKLQCAYSAASAGMFNFTKAAAMEYGSDNIRINAVAQGEAEETERLSFDPEISKQAMSHNIIQRQAKPEEIAKAAVFLASDDAGYITGTVMTVDGGFTVGYTRDF